MFWSHFHPVHSPQSKSSWRYFQRKIQQLTHTLVKDLLSFHSQQLQECAMRFMTLTVSNKQICTSISTQAVNLENVYTYSQLA